MHWIFILLALIAGAAMPTQGAINSKLATYVQSPLHSAFISFVVGTAALLIYILFSGTSIQTLGGVRQAPLITWSGGLLGAFFVTVVILAVPRLGVALTFSLIVLGQMLATLPIDHYGFMGVVIREINWPRILGVLLIIAGVILIRKF